MKLLQEVSEIARKRLSSSIQQDGIAVMVTCWLVAIPGAYDSATLL
jgi:hypothetical protein